MKLKAVQAQSQACGRFYEWLTSEKCVSMEQSYEYEVDEDGFKIWRDSDGNIVEDYEDPSSCWNTKKAEKYKKMRDELGIDCRLTLKQGGSVTIPIRQNITSLLAEFFEIDEKKLEEEKVAMLDECRAAHAVK